MLMNKNAVVVPVSKPRNPVTEKRATIRHKNRKRAQQLVPPKQLENE